MTDIQIDMTQVQKMIVAHQTALMSFCAEWAMAYPEKIDEAATFLSGLETTYELPAGTFAKTTRVLRGETDEA
ncbi:hypothetical protein RLEG12_18645 [Rhizobium leguminosarum bv. trifolii CB782]|nr:hypothetical protein RLEG12_18645 [Rhizobium leguminosarum bv. trifolii CB782]